MQNFFEKIINWVTSNWEMITIYALAGLAFLFLITIIVIKIKNKLETKKILKELNEIKTEKQHLEVENYNIENDIQNKLLKIEGLISKSNDYISTTNAHIKESQNELYLNYDAVLSEVTEIKKLNTSTKSTLEFIAKKNTENEELLENIIELQNGNASMLEELNSKKEKELEDPNTISLSLFNFLSKKEIISLCKNFDIYSGLSTASKEELIKVLDINLAYEVIDNSIVFKKK